MKSVSVEFKSAINEADSPGVEVQLWLSDLSKGEAMVDRTSYLDLASVGNITERIEKGLNEFKAGDINLRVYNTNDFFLKNYDPSAGEVGDGLFERGNIIKVQLRFKFQGIDTVSPSEPTITKFGGYLDEDSIRRKGENLIEFHCISWHKDLENWNAERVADKTNNPFKNITGLFWEYGHADHPIIIDNEGEMGVHILKHTKSGSDHYWQYDSGDKVKGNSGIVSVWNEYKDAEGSLAQKEQGFKFKIIGTLPEDSQEDIIVVIWNYEAGSSNRFMVPAYWYENISINLAIRKLLNNVGRDEFHLTGVIPDDFTHRAIKLNDIPVSGGEKYLNFFNRFEGHTNCRDIIYAGDDTFYFGSNGDLCKATRIANDITYTILKNISATKKIGKIWLFGGLVVGQLWDSYDFGAGYGGVKEYGSCDTIFKYDITGDSVTTMTIEDIGLQGLVVAPPPTGYYSGGKYDNPESRMAKHPDDNKLYFVFTRWLPAPPTFPDGVLRVWEVDVDAWTKTAIWDSDDVSEPEKVGWCIEYILCTRKGLYFSAGGYPTEVNADKFVYRYNFSTGNVEDISSQFNTFFGIAHIGNGNANLKNDASTNGQILLQCWVGSGDYTNRYITWLDESFDVLKTDPAYLMYDIRNSISHHFIDDLANSVGWGINQTPVKCIKILPNFITDSSVNFPAGYIVENDPVYIDETKENIAGMVEIDGQDLALFFYTDIRPVSIILADFSNMTIRSALDEFATGFMCSYQRTMYDYFFFYYREYPRGSIYDLTFSQYYHPPKIALWKERYDGVILNGQDYEGNPLQWAQGDITGQNVKVLTLASRFIDNQTGQEIVNWMHNFFSRKRRVFYVNLKFLIQLELQDEVKFKLLWDDSTWLYAFCYELEYQHDKHQIRAKLVELEGEEIHKLTISKIGHELVT